MGSHVRSGVSNYSLQQIDELERATGRLPAVNQIEWSPALFDRDVLEGHRRRGVQLEGYSPLKTMNLRDPRLVADRGASTASPRRRSSSAGTSSTGSSRSRSRRTPERIAENAAIFDFQLTASEVEGLDALGGR